jgi:hypothetical protein
MTVGSAWRVAAAVAVALGVLPGRAHAEGQTAVKPDASHAARASGGVIKPPQGTDPGIKARVPSPGRFPTPVIKPAMPPKG